MLRLTEEMVAARAKRSNLGTMKQLNFWGSNLNDIYIVKEMTDIEVLGLSANKISSLEQFIHCQKLQKLCLRNNLIADISELAILKELPAFRNLRIAGNPCIGKKGPNYRLAVLRILPNLTVLDNIKVTPEELEAATRCESNRSLKEEERNNEVKEPEKEHQGLPPQYVKVQHSPRQRNETQQYQQRSPKPCNEQQQSQEEERNNEVKEPEEEHQGPPPQYVKVQHSPRQRNESKQYQQPSPKPCNEQQQSQEEEGSRYVNRNGNPRENGDQWEEPQRMTHRRPHEEPYCDPVSLIENTHYNSTRSNIRTANLLTATLCLLKELDCASLLVVEDEVRHRIDQLFGE